MPITHVQVKHGEDTHLKIGDDTSRPYPVWVRRSPLNVELHGKLYAVNMDWGEDKRSLIVHRCNQIDEGWYEAYVGGICMQRTYVEVTGKSDQYGMYACYLKLIRFSYSYYSNSEHVYQL